MPSFRGMVGVKHMEGPKMHQGWLRLGLVLSVVWFLGVGWVLWAKQDATIRSEFAGQWRNCLFLQQSNRDEYRQCQAKAQVRHNQQQAEIAKRVLSLLLMDFASLVLSWIAVGLGIVVFRWVMKGFVGADNAIRPPPLNADSWKTFGRHSR